jgi:hypothetical protein
LPGSQTESESGETIAAYLATVGWLTRQPIVSPAHRHRSLRPAPILAPRDELVDSRPDADREVRAVAFSREVRDGRGRVWTLREKRLSRDWTAAHLAARTLARAAHGWLLFENGLRQIVVTPPPPRWQEWDDRALIRLMERHAPRRTARRRG